MARGGWPASVTPADSEHEGRAGPQTWRLGTLRPPWAFRGRLALGAQWRGGGRAGVGRRARSGGGNERQGSASSSGHALWKDIPSSFPWKRRRLLPGIRTGPRRQTSCSQSSLAGPAPKRRSPEGRLGRPGLLTFLRLTTLAPAFSCSLPCKAPPQESRSPQELLATARERLQMCTAGPWPAPDSGRMGSRQEIFTCPRRRWQSRESCWK